MAPGLDTQLERVVDEALKSGDVRPLDVFLQRHMNEMAPIKCSAQFLTKLDKLVSRSLDQKDPKSASLALSILYKCGKRLKLPGGCQGLSGVITQGLLKKMVRWFEKCRQLWIQCGPHWNENLFNLSEDFFDALMVVHEACKEGTCKITESFLYPIGQLAVDPGVYILIQKEAIRKFNFILDKIPAELKKEKKIVTSQEASDIMIKVAGRIMKGGDYDLQTALMEALCRMATPVQRKELANRWFSMDHVASAFVKIRDSDFETDCRKFLNLVNGMQGDRRRVFSYPCLEVYLDKHELLMPPDEKLEEFWIDFNLDSHSISFYFSSSDEEAQEGQWETMCINENEVQSYTVTERGKRKVLQLQLSELVVVGEIEGLSLTIYFSSSLDILQAACTVYGHSKKKSFVRKTGTSVVKTTVNIIMEDNISQVVPESQMSLSENEKNTALSAPATRATSLQITASKHSNKNKVAKHKRNIPLAQAVDLVTAGQGEEQTLELCIVPDTQPTSEKNISLDWNKISVSEVFMMPTQKISFVPKPEPRSSLAQQQARLSSKPRLSVPGCSVSQKQLHTELTHRLQQVFRERNQDPAHQEPSASQRKMSDIREGSKGRSSVDRCASVVCTPTKQQVQRNSLVKGKSKQQMSLEADAVPIKAPAKTTTTKAMQERASPGVKVDTNGVISSKEKRDAEVAGSMVKLISSRYEIKSQSTVKDTAKMMAKSWIPPVVNRPVFNLSWTSSAKRDISVAVSRMNSHSKTTTNSTRQRNDVFAFKTDTPSSVGGKNKTCANISALSSSDIRDSSSLPSTTKKGQAVAKEKRHVKKHLFSDTDYSTTDASWLRESNRKPKPKVITYPRQAPKAVSPHTSCESPDLSPLAEKPVKGNAKLKKKKPDMKERVKPAAAPNRAQAAGRRPQRSAAISMKSYREPDTDDSQSEADNPPVSKKNPSTKHLENAGKTHEAAQVTKTKTQYFIGEHRKSEKTHFEKRKHTSSEQSTDTYRRLDSNNKPDLKKRLGVKKQRPENVLPETPKLNKKNVVSAQEHTIGLKDSWAAHQTSFCSSPPSIEKMRSAERSAPTLGLTCSPLLTPRGSPLPASLDRPCEDTPSPILLLPKPRSSVSSKGNVGPSSFYGAGKKRSSSKTRSNPSIPSFPSLTPISLLIPSFPSLTPLGRTQALGAPTGPHAAEINPIQQCLPSAAQSPLPLSSQPPLTSTLLELDKPSMHSPPQSPILEDSFNHGTQYNISKVSSVSLVSSAQSSVLTRGVKDSPTAALALSRKAEETPSSDRDRKSEQLHISGPSRKRHVSPSSSSEEDELDERKKRKMRGQRSPRMKPRKLFKSFAEVSADGVAGRTMSSSHTISASHWEADVGDEDIDEDFELPKVAGNPIDLCKQFSSELKDKFQNQYNVVEVYSKQSLKTVQKHVSSLNTQVTKYRTQRLEQIQKVLLEEIHNLEQDDTVLKSMEKDLSIHWKKQLMAFHSYQEQEVKRNETLKKALQSNMCHSVEYEERIFRSQMCLIRNDMKSVQDRLLNEMQEGELQSVKRGLHALFFS